MHDVACVFERAVMRSKDAQKQLARTSLMQESQPVTYASRALTPAEQRYSQIEKELLAQVFGLEHNNYYTFGR